MSGGAVPVVQVGVDHRTVAPTVLGGLSRRADDLTTWPSPAAVGGVVVLRTCHRLELYAEGVGEAAVANAFEAWLGDAWPSSGVNVVVRSGEVAARHLLRVSAGLESAVVGEDQVLGQVRSAYREACRRRAPGPVLHRLFHAAFRAGKRVRSETALGSGGRSLAGCAVALLREQLSDFGERTVMVLGAGEMGSLAARRLRDRRVGRLLVCNRSWLRACMLAREVAAEPVPWSWRYRGLAEADAAVCATGAPSPVVDARRLADAVRWRRDPLLVVDLAVPANVGEPEEEASKVRVITMDEMVRRLEIQEDRRLEAVAAAEHVVELELDRWTDWLRGRGADGAGSLEVLSRAGSA